MIANPSLVAALRQALGAEAVLTAAEELAYYGTDRCRGGWPVLPSVIVRPSSITGVQETVRLCRQHHAKIVPSGGRTGLTGAATATAGEVVVSLERMHRVLRIDTVGRTLTCEAGATVQTVHDAAASVGLNYPIDFTAKGSAQIGGSISTNAGGVRVLRYGVTRDWVMGVRVVLASGEVLETGGPLVKDNTGYDLRQLFVGAEGTLGIIVEATLRLCRPPIDEIVVLCAVPDDASVLELFERVQRSELVLQAFECFDAACVSHVLRHRGRLNTPGPFLTSSPRHVLLAVEVEHAGSEANEAVRAQIEAVLGIALEAGVIEDAVVSASMQQARELWAWREDISEALHAHTPHKSDITVPIAKVAAFSQRWRELAAEHLPRYPALIFGHVGDGNLHLNVLRPDHEPLDQFLSHCQQFAARTYALVAENDGSISAEHGIGLLKREYLGYSRDTNELALMRAIKHVFDPEGLFNPGKVFTE